MAAWGLRHLRGIFYLRLLDVKLLRLRDDFWRGGTLLCAFSCSLLYHPEEEDYSSRFPAGSHCRLPGSETIPLLSFVFVMAADFSSFHFICTVSCTIQSKMFVANTISDSLALLLRRSEAAPESDELL